MQKLILNSMMIAALAFAATTAHAASRFLVCQSAETGALEQLKADASQYPLLNDVKVWSYADGKGTLLRASATESSEEALAQNDPDYPGFYVRSPDATRLSFFFDGSGDAGYYLLLPVNLASLGGGASFSVPLFYHWDDREGRSSYEEGSSTATCRFADE